MSEAVQKTKEAIDRGNLLLAYDLAETAIADGDDSQELRHLIVLSLARMGNAAKAMELYQEYGLDHSPDSHHQAIAARILKDTALAMPVGNERIVALKNACEAYSTLYQADNDTYLGINAATLAFLSNQGEVARSLAADILAHPAIDDPQNYYDSATKAEALCLLQRYDEAGAVLNRACELPGANPGSRSSSSKQLALIADTMGLDVEKQHDFLSPILPPSVIHYCGHIFLEDADQEKRLRDVIDQYLNENDVGFAYGSIAAGSDILIAEAVLDRGGELHVTLPFDQEDFVAQSITTAGSGWHKRFERCLASATSINFATEMAYVGDPSQFAYASKVAMGQAKLRGQFLGSPVEQLAIWDGVASNGPAGTGADVENWRGYGGTTKIIDAAELNRNMGWAKKPAKDSVKRNIVAILFTDFPGFSKLSESALPEFWNGVMGRMAKVLNNHKAHVITQNSWGDAVHAVMPNVEDAAQIASELQDALLDFDFARLGLTETSGMRIGVHYGPAFEMEDMITGKVNFYGTEISRAARIEPVTPAGAVFVTEPFAAILSLEASDKFRSDYVGNVKLAKDYGTYPIFRLSRS